MFIKCLNGKSQLKRAVRCGTLLVCIAAVVGCGDPGIARIERKETMGANGIQLAGTPLYSDVLKSRAITAENQTGAKGQGGQEQGGRKGLPCLWNLKKDQVYTFAEIDGPGMIRHIWITVQNTGPLKMRNLILRFYWDGQETPSVEVPLTDFFGVSHGQTRPYESAFVTMPEGKGFNSYFLMPFRKKAKLTVCNEVGEDVGMFFYQVDWTVQLQHIRQGVK